MTGLSSFTPGGEIRCHGCEYRTGSVAEPDCLVAVELRDDGERMHARCCPDDDQLNNIQAGGCPVCGGPLPCPTCLAALRCDVA